MNRIAYGVAVCATGIGMLWAQEPDGATAVPAPAPPEAAAATGEPAPAEAGRRARPGNGLGAERGRRHEGGQPGQGSAPGAFMDRLRQEHPDLYKRLSKLYQEDREGFFQEVRNLMRERGTPTAERTGPAGRGPRDSVEEQRCRDLSRQYRESNDPAAKERLKGELAAAIEAAFEARLRSSQERIVLLEKQLQEFRQRLEHMEANREQICAGRLNELTTPPELRWDGNW